MADPRFKNIELKVGIFVLFAIVAIIVVVIAMGISKDVFVKKVYIEVYTNTGDDVSKGTPVKYSGFQISRVDDVRLQDDGRVVMYIGIPTKYTKWLRQDSVFKLGAQNIIGSTFITIQTNLESKSPSIVNGSNFVLVRDEGFQAILEKAIPVIDDLKQIVSNINVILTRAADKDGDVSKLLRGLGSLGDDIYNKEGSLGYLTRTDFVQTEIAKFLQDLKTFSETSIKVAQNVEKGSVKLDNALSAIEKNADPIATQTLSAVEQVNEMSKTLKPTIERLDQISKNIERITKNAADGTENLDQLRSEIQSIVESGNELLLKIQNTWPLTPPKTPEKVPLK